MISILVLPWQQEDVVREIEPPQSVRCIGVVDVPIEKRGVVAIANTNDGLGVIHLQVDHHEGMRRLDAEDLRRHDVEEPVTSGGFSKILDAVGDQHVPIQGVTMPLFRTDKRAEICLETGRLVFLSLHDCSDLALQEGESRWDVSPGRGCGAWIKCSPRPVSGSGVWSEGRWCAGCSCFLDDSVLRQGAQAPLTFAVKCAISPLLWG